LASFFFTPRDVNVAAKTDQPHKDVRAAAELSSEGADPFTADQQQTRARLDGLSKLESQQALRANAEAKHGEEVPLLQARAASSWTALLNSNRTAFLRLAQQAAAAPTHTAHCTLCDGTGMLDFCSLCGNTGNCVRCAGSGFVMGQYCPACLGSGKCSLCFGTGKMPCPFCDDGIIDAKSVFPPALPPIH
jgi:hypothetical protein